MTQHAEYTDHECRIAALLAIDEGRVWLTSIMQAGHHATEIGRLAGINGSTVGAVKYGRRTNFDTRLRMVRALEKLAVQHSIQSPNGRVADAPAVSEEQDGQLRLDAGIDVTPAAWLNDLIALHKAIGKHELVSGPKVRNVLEQIIRDLGGEV